MCGFIGVVSNICLNPEVLASIKKMGLSIAHRGPDNTSQWFSIGKSSIKGAGQAEVHVGMEFNRLAIRDLSSLGNQPYVSKLGNVICFNGEIYNTHHLIKNISSGGDVCNFESRSDTEILMKYFELFGYEKLIADIDGMYAIMLYDSKSQTTFITRDFFGIKPLFYTVHNESIVVSSEIKSFKFLSGFNFEFNEDAFKKSAMFLQFNDPLVKGVCSVGPNRTIVIKSNANQLEIEERENNVLPQWRGGNWGADLNHFETLMINNILDSSLSDCSVSAQLSGGIDSSLIARTLRKHGAIGKTFSVDQKATQLSEHAYFSKVLNTIGCASTVLDLDYNQIVADFNDVTHYLDSPVTHPNTFGIYYVAKEASKEFKVLLSGEGADEIFGGYQRHAMTNPASMSFLRARLVADYWQFGGKSILNVPLKHMYSLFGQDLMSPSLLKILFDEFAVMEGLEERIDFLRHCKYSGLQKILTYDQTFYLPSLLQRQDRMNMRFSVENRVPFLNFDFVKTVYNEFSIDNFLRPHLFAFSSKKINRRTKIFPKLLSEKYFGSDFAFRKKMGFPIDLGQLTEVSSFKEMLREEMLPSLQKFGFWRYKIGEFEKLSVNLSNYDKFFLFSLGSFLRAFDA